MRRADIIPKHAGVYPSVVYAAPVGARNIQAYRYRCSDKNSFGARQLNRKPLSLFYSPFHFCWMKSLSCDKAKSLARKRRDGSENFTSLKYAPCDGVDPVRPNLFE